MGTADIDFDVPRDLIMNVIADKSGSTMKIVLSTNVEAWLMRLCSTEGLIEVSKHARKGAMPFPSDNIFSVTTPKGG